MIISEFIAYYPAYQLEHVLAMYLTAFLVLYGAMKRNMAASDLNFVIKTRAAHAEGDVLKGYTDKLLDEYKGNAEILRQIEVIKGLKNEQ